MRSLKLRSVSQAQTSMAANRPRSVFVGNIPYDATEEQLKEIFSEVGPVLSFRIVFDKETGKSKGYGFCDFSDPNVALSATRNLNGRDINGRQLRVNFAEDSKTLTPSGPSGGPSSEPSHPQTPQGPPQSGVQMEINKLIENMSLTQLYEVMVQMKGLLQQSPDQVRRLLQASPQFTYALLQAQVKLGMVTPQMAQQLVSAPAPPPVPLGSGQMGGGPIGGPMGGQMGVPMGGPMAPTMSFGQLPPPSSFGAAPFGLSANDLATLVQQGGYIPGVGQVTPQLIAQLGLQLPSSAPLAPAPSTAAIAASLPPEQLALLDQVLSLTPDQIDRLPPHERQPLLELRQTMLAMGMNNFRR